MPRASFSAFAPGPMNILHFFTRRIHSSLTAAGVALLVCLSTSPAQAEIPREDALRFVRGYLSAAQNSTPDEEVRHYAPRVRYFDSGTVDQSFVAADQRRYYKLWPQRTFELLEEPEIVAQEDDAVTLRFIIRYEVNNGDRRATGATQNTMQVQRIGDGLKIVAMSERKVNLKALPRPTIDSSRAAPATDRTEDRVEVKPADKAPRSKPAEPAMAVDKTDPKPKLQEMPAPAGGTGPSHPAQGAGEAPTQANGSAPPVPVIATPVPGSPGLVYLPGTEQTSKNMIDVRGYSSGQKVKDPRNGQIFIVP